MLVLESIKRRLCQRTTSGRIAEIIEMTAIAVVRYSARCSRMRALCVFIRMRFSSRLVMFFTLLLIIKSYMYVEQSLCIRVNVYNGLDVKYDETKKKKKKRTFPKFFFLLLNSLREFI